MGLNPTGSPFLRASARTGVRNLPSRELLPDCCHGTAESRGSRQSAQSIAKRLRMMLNGGSRLTPNESLVSGNILATTEPRSDRTKPTQLDQSDEFEWVSIGGDGGI
ncbi:hypothetical protein GCM10025760_20510 [Microbacterium yannicii]|uniref:Uncharacterized protein n=1 Tax=Microbacterium yannicii TaxID=671622 RepID=A0ABP9MBT9_9MICO